MNEDNPPILLLALGNDILADDGVGFIAARMLKEEISSYVDVVESSEAGLALLEILTGYQKAIILDAMVTGKYPPGTVVELNPSHFSKIVAPSPHYAGLPEILALAERLEVPFPNELSILAMEVENPYEIREGLSHSVERALPDLVGKVRERLASWKVVLEYSPV